jgi:hypothetical protein
MAGDTPARPSAAWPGDELHGDLCTAEHQGQDRARPLVQRPAAGGKPDGGQGVMKLSGAHTHPEMSSRGSGNRWLLILGAITLAAIAGPVAHAIRDLIMMLAITVAVLLAAAGTAAALTHRMRRRGTRAFTRRGTPSLPAPEHRALGRAQEVHLHFHGVSAEDLAAIIARQDEAGE